MKWNQYRHPDPNIGNVTSVYLNSDRTLIKRHYIKAGVTVSGATSIHQQEYVDAKWKNETDALIRFKDMDWVPELVEINEQERYVIQKYYGPDLLLQGTRGVPNIEDQVVEIYEYFKEINVYKFNGALANMTRRGSRVIMFDFKFMRQRTADLKPFAIQEIEEWLWKISPTISDKLKALI